MCPPSPPRASFRAGAITRANMTGVSSGTTICRGVRAVSARRLDERVCRAATELIFWVLFSLWSGGVRKARAGEAQVDVVEGGLARADGAGADAGGVDRGDRLRGGVLVQRDREGRADGEGVVAGDALRAQRCERRWSVAVL